MQRLEQRRSKNQPNTKSPSNLQKCRMSESQGQTCRNETKDEEIDHTKSAQRNPKPLYQNHQRYHNGTLPTPDPQITAVTKSEKKCENSESWPWSLNVPQKTERSTAYRLLRRTWPSPAKESAPPPPIPLSSPQRFLYASGFLSPKPDLVLVIWVRKKWTIYKWDEICCVATYFTKIVLRTRGDHVRFCDLVVLPIKDLIRIKESV